MTSVTWAEVPLTLDAGLLDETQVHDVWGSVVRAWESGESEQALNQAEALARARAEAGWPALYTASVQAETFSRSCLAAGRSECALRWADISVILAPVMGRSFRYRAWTYYQSGGDWGKIFSDLKKSWEVDLASKTAKSIALSRTGWLVSRGCWGFVFLLTLCITLKLTRSFGLVWRKWLPWLTGRAQIVASFTSILMPWIFGAPLLVSCAWIWLLSVLCERRATQLVVIGVFGLTSVLVWTEPLHYRTLNEASYGERWNERLRQTPEKRFLIPVTDLDTTTFRLAWSGERDKARSILEQAARLGELGPDAWTLLGILRADSLGLTASIDAFEEAISQEPAALEARFNKQRSHFALAQHQEAMAAYGVLKSLAPTLCAMWSDTAFERPPHGFVYPTIPLAQKPISLPSEGPIWRAEDVGSGALRSLSGLSRADGLRLLVSGGVLAIALIFLRRQLVSSRSCSDCGYMVEWSQLMWRPMLCARCLPYKLSGKQRTMWTWSHFKGVRRERFRLNFGRVLGLALPGFDHAWLGSPYIAVALMLPGAVAWMVLAGGLAWVEVPSVYRDSMMGVELIPAAGLLGATYLVSSFLRLQREQ